MTKRNISVLFCMIMVGGSFASDFEIKGTIGFSKLINFTTEYYDGVVSKGAIDLYTNSIQFSFAGYYSLRQNIKIGLNYARNGFKLNGNAFSSGDMMFGQVVADKCAISALMGKVFQNLLFSYLILETGPYIIQDNTWAMDGQGREVFSHAFCGSFFWGVGLGYGIDYYFTRFVGLSLETRIETATAQNLWAIYPDIEIGLVACFGRNKTKLP